MRPGVIPLPPPVAPLRRVTPTTLQAYRECPLRAVWSAARQRPLLPTFVGAALGRAVHSVMESARGGHVRSRDDFESVWGQCVGEEEARLLQSWTEAHLVPLSRSVRDYEQKKELCWLALKDLTLQPRHEGLRAPLVWSPCGNELWLETRDGVCGGRVDRISTRGGLIELIDYKSTILSPPGGARWDQGSYASQLKYYAALYHAQSGEWPTALKIVANGGREIEVPFTHEECEALLKEAYALLARVNCTIRRTSTDKEKTLSSLARPSPRSCSRCLYRPVCPPYWDARPQVLDPDWPNDLHGTIIERGVWGKDRSYLDILPCEEDGAVKVIEVSPRRHPALLIGREEVYIFSLLRSKDRPGVFREGNYTTIYVPGR